MCETTKEVVRMVPTACEAAVSAETTPDNEPQLDFIRRQIVEDTASGKYDGRIHTRFPPEPNGYLHIGHTKAICLNFGIKYENEGAQCNLRFDDTNPIKEETRYVDAIKRDIAWLGFEWDNELYASDYFDQLYEWALKLIREGNAYVDELSAEEMRAYRGTLKEPGKNSPHRNRPIEENLDLFERMRAGEFEEGTYVLRAKVDMSSPNITMRDPVMYRILYSKHHRTGDKWCIYPLYDWTHGQSDSIEGVTHSLCSLEFENHRPLYEWYTAAIGIYQPQQIEFARLNLSHTVVSKRKLIRLVNEGVVTGWDDPRMPTVAALRRRGYTPTAIKNFCRDIGMARAHNRVQLQQLEAVVRDDLNLTTPRVMAVLDPLKVVITNYPEGQVEEMDVKNCPQIRESTAMRTVPFTREILIEREDFAEEPPPKWKRLSLGWEVRLMGAYWIKCESVVKDDAGNITEIHCTYDVETKGGIKPPDGRKPKGTLHWVSAEHSLPATVNLYETLFVNENPEASGDFMDDVNPDSLTVLTDSRVELNLAAVEAEDRFQFMRMGFFAVDSDSTADNLIFNRTVTLRDTWRK